MKANKTSRKFYSIVIVPEDRCMACFRAYRHLKLPGDTGSPVSLLLGA